MNSEPESLNARASVMTQLEKDLVRLVIFAPMRFYHCDNAEFAPSDMLSHLPSLNISTLHTIPVSS